MASPRGGLTVTKDPLLTLAEINALDYEFRKSTANGYNVDPVPVSPAFGFHSEPPAKSPSVTHIDKKPEEPAA